MQAQIDTQSGVLHAEEKDYKTAYSYFFEAMEAFFTQESPLATQSLKHMLLCKIMTNASEEVPGLIDGKASKTGTLDELEAMRAIAEAYKERSLAKLIETMAKYPKELKEVLASRAPSPSRARVECRWEGPRVGERGGSFHEFSLGSSDRRVALRPARNRSQQSKLNILTLNP